MRSIRGSVVSVLGAAAIVLAMAVPPASAGAGNLDPTFGGDGKVATNFKSGGLASAVALQPDGKIVVAGSSGGGFTLVRYRHSGHLDTTFGGDGKVSTRFAGSAVAFGVAIQADGKIVAAGRAGGPAGRFALARYKTGGRLDTSFSGNGKVLTRFAGGGVAFDVAIQQDGKIVAAGESQGFSRFALARYRPGGRLDPSFGGDGKVTTYFAGGANALAIQADGRIVAAGTRDINAFALARYTTSGLLDKTFGDRGKVTTDVGSGETSANGVAIQTDGRIVAGGVTNVPHEAGDTFGPGRFALARYLRNGMLDRSFSGDGKVRTRFGRVGSAANAVAIQSDGKIVAVGATSHKFALARYGRDGTLDPTFSGNGKVVTPFPGGAFANDLAIQPNGKVVAVGQGSAGFALARYLA